MCPKEANVAYFDDSTDSVLHVKEILKNHGHKLVLADRNKEYILKNLATLFTKYDVEVVMLDNCLGESDHDGLEILTEIRKQFPEMPVIGFSSEKFPGTNIDLGRENIDKLCQTIDDL